MSFPVMSAYSISKYGVEAFSDALRREMSPWRVLVSVIEPGIFQTAIRYQVPNSVKQLWNNLSPEMKEDYEDKHLDGSKSRMLLQCHKFPQSVYAGSFLVPRCETDYHVCFRRNWHRSK